jgi:four helix bundle protein
MFDFQKLTVYQKAKALNTSILRLIAENRFDNYVNDQLKRATFSIMLNIAEGVGFPFLVQFKNRIYYSYFNNFLFQEGLCGAKA